MNFFELPTLGNSLSDRGRASNYIRRKNFSISVMKRSMGEFHCCKKWFFWSFACHFGYDFCGAPILVRRRRIVGIKLRSFTAELGEGRLGSKDSRLGESY